MKNCNATLIALHSDPRKKFHFPVEAIKSTEVAEHKWGSHNSNFQFFEVELEITLSLMNSIKTISNPFLIHIQ